MLTRFICWPGGKKIMGECKSEKELLPCPFCGSPPVIFKSDRGKVWCSNDKCPTRYSRMSQEDWNTRVEQKKMVLK